VCNAKREEEPTSSRWETKNPPPLKRAGTRGEGEASATRKMRKKEDGDHQRGRKLKDLGKKDSKVVSRNNRFHQKEKNYPTRSPKI